MLLISELAKVTNTTIDAIRFYEKKGLLKPASKAKNNYRYYDEMSIKKLEFIRNCRNLDLSIEEITFLLSEASQPTKNCQTVNTLIDDHLKKVAHKIEELKKFQKDLIKIRNSCRETDLIDSCHIIQSLYGRK